MALFEDKNKIIEELRGQVNIQKFKIEDLEREKENLLARIEHLQSDSLISSLEKKIKKQEEYINTYVTAVLEDPKGAKRHKIKEQILEQAEVAQMTADVKQELSGGEIENE